jgi:PBP1b-binding outer membrane lipoprotein LpoB
VTRQRLALLVPAVVLVLSGCLDQPEEANDNGPQEQPIAPPSVVREPVPVESAPDAVEQPGPSLSPAR